MVIKIIVYEIESVIEHVGVGSRSDETGHSGLFRRRRKWGRDGCSIMLDVIGKRWSWCRSRWWMNGRGALVAGHMWYGGGDVGDELPVWWGGGVGAGHAVGEERAVGGSVVVGSMEEATIGSGPGLPEGDAGRGVDLIANFAHYFDLIRGPGVWCPIGAEARATGRRAAGLGRWRWTRIRCGRGCSRGRWWGSATAIPACIGGVWRGGRVRISACQGPLLRVYLAIGEDA